MDVKARLMAIAIAGVATAGSVAIVGGTAAAGQPCPALPQGSEHVALDAANFVAVVDNPLWPMAPGTTWIYRETNDEGDVARNVVRVKQRTRTIEGIEATVVRDDVLEQGDLVEHTFDWYAQDTCGNVWYLGENTQTLRHGHVVSTEGSWEAGVDGAEAGVIVPADPQPLQDYRQEYLAGQAEDNARTLSIDEQVEVPFGHFTGAMLVRESTPLEPRLLEYKLYAPGVGPAMAMSVSGETDREVLIDMRTP
jgi:hypothetical protein